MNRALKLSHPCVILIYFLGLLILTAICRHPLMAIIITVAEVFWFLWHKRSIKAILPYLLLWLILALSNPLFVHRGNTILFQIHYTTFTLEALLYGIQYSALLMDMLLLFVMFQQYFGREHWVFLFGNLLPKTGVLFSMVLGLLPRYKRQGEQYNAVQKQLFQDSALKRLLKIFSMETTWAFESSMDQLDSMNARGYGMGRRTHFHLFQFERTDAIHLTEVLILSGINVCAFHIFYSGFYFYPFIIWNPITMKDILFCLLCALEFLLPMIWRDKL